MKFNKEQPETCELSNLRLIFKSIAHGDKQILESANGELLPLQYKGFLNSTEFEIRDIESRLIFELFGEYPLSSGNEEEYLNIRSVFRLPEK